MSRDPVLASAWHVHLPGIDLASALARMDLSQRSQIPGLLQGLEAEMARIDAATAQQVVAEARIAEAHRRITEHHANDQFPAGG